MSVPLELQTAPVGPVVCTYESMAVTSVGLQFSFPQKHTRTPYLSRDEQQGLQRKVGTKGQLH